MVQRINGFSGMDIDGTVKKLMDAQRIPVDKLYQKKQIIQWQKDSYREMNTKLYDYRNSKLTNYRLEGTFSAKKVDITGDTTAASATAAPDAIAGTISVQVARLATAASNNSAADVRTAAGQAATGGFDPNAKLSTQTANLTTLDTTNPTVDKSFVINGTTVTYNVNNDSLNDIIARINKTANVSANYDAAAGKVAFISKQTGYVNDPTNPASQSSPTSPKGELITFSGAFLTGTLGMTGAGTAAVNANVTVNGLQTTSNSNTLKVNGVQITLLKQGGTTATLNVKTDTDSIVNSVKNFITDYNDLIKTVGDKIKETRYRDYLPLTDDQKKSMKDSEITAWETKAKSGLLRNDSTLSKVLNDLRSDIMNPVTINTKPTTLASIGITSGAYQENGKLYLDETKLRAAIDANPDVVKNLLSQTGTDTTNRTDIGVAKRMYDDVQKTMDAITNRAGSNFSTASYDNSILGKQTLEISKQIDTRNMRLQDLESRYYRQFSAMESAMSKFNAQSAQLLGATGGR